MAGKEIFSPQSEFDNKSFRYNVTPVFFDRSKHPTALQKYEDPIRKVEELDNSEEAWERIEGSLRFILTTTTTASKIGSAEEVIRAARLSVAGMSDSHTAREFGVGRIVVRQARKMIHRAMDWSLTEEEKRQIGLPEQALGERDRKAVRKSVIFGPIMDKLEQEEDLLVRAQDHPDLIRVIELLSDGHSFQDIVQAYGIEKYTPMEKIHNISRTFSNFFTPGRIDIDKRIGYYLDRYFFQMLAFARLFSPESFEAYGGVGYQIQKTLRSLRRLADYPTGASTRVLSNARAFLVELPYIESVFEQNGNGNAQMNIKGYLATYEKQNILPSPLAHTLEEVLKGRTPGDIARTFVRGGVAIADSTLQKNIGNMLRFVENTILKPNGGNWTDRTFIQEMSRNRKKEIRDILKELAVRHKRDNLQDII